MIYVGRALYMIARFRVVRTDGKIEERIFIGPQEKFDKSFQRLSDLEEVVQVVSDKPVQQ